MTKAELLPAPGGEYTEQFIFVLESCRNVTFRKSQVFVWSYINAYYSGMASLAELGEFLFTIHKFSSHLRGVIGWLCFARFPGLNTHHGVEMLPKSLLCFDSNERR